MSKFKIRESYLLLLIVLGLVSLGIYTTYALFTASTSINDVVGITATLDIGKSLTEYEVITVPAGETKLIELNVVNSYNGNIYYGAWYQIVKGNSDNIQIGLYTERNSNPGSGSLSSSSNINLLVGITNDNSTSVTLYIGVKGSLTNELNLGTNKILIPDGFTIVPPNLDTSGANTPDLVQGLIPVMYDGSKWVKADETNSNETYKWYDYNNKLWANAVLVTSTNRSTYQNASAGTTINESDILAYYVWIPRYKYKVWNISKQAGAESTYAYNAYTEGIDIVFENEKETTGTISCTYNFNVSSINLSNTTAETCTGSNGDYYTHPTFTFGSDELRGFWISKFEMSSSNPTAQYGGGNVTNLTVRSLPNVSSWRALNINNANIVIQNMQISNNIYGLSTSRTNTDSHMLKNMEWGAVTYLTNSNYGRCTNGTCTEVTINNCDSQVTGIGGDTVSASSSSTTCTTAANKYNGAKGMLASTTGNITGVYDMSGGAMEHVMGNMSKQNYNYTFYPVTSGLSSSWYAANQKYIDTYAYDGESGSQKACNRGKLGDATAEVALLTECTFAAGTSAWFIRGNNNSYSYKGIFSITTHEGSAFYWPTTRPILVSISN